MNGVAFSEVAVLVTYAAHFRVVIRHFMRCLRWT